MMFSLFYRKYKGFTLVDVMMAVTLMSVLVILMGSFAGDVFRYRRFISTHQRLRSEVFPLVVSTIPGIIREASAIDYSKSDENVLSLFVDAYEKKTIQIVFQKQDGVGRLVLRRGDLETVLHSDFIRIDDFSVDIPFDPSLESGERLQDLRAFQPYVSFRLKAHSVSDLDTSSVKQLSFFDSPRVFYVGSATIRNYSFSNLRQS